MNLETASNCQKCYVRLYIFKIEVHEDVKQRNEWLENNTTNYYVSVVP